MWQQESCFGHLSGEQNHKHCWVSQAEKSLIVPSIFIDTEDNEIIIKYIL